MNRDTPRPGISLVAPARNEEEVIGRFVQKCLAAIAPHAPREILIVDDASADQTGAILDELAGRHPELRVIHSRTRLGLTGAMWKGVLAARNDIIVFLPSDLEADPEEDVPLLMEAIGRGAHFVVGSRQNRRQTWLKNLSSKAFNSVCRLLFHLDIHDIGWVKAFHRDIVHQVEPLRSDWHRFLAILAHQAGYRVVEIPVRAHPRPGGHSKFGRFGLGRAFGGFLDLIVIKFLVSFSRQPMRVFGTLGALSLLAGFAIGIYIVYLNYCVLGNVSTRLPLVILSVLFVLVGVQLFCFGIIAEYLSSLREAARQGKDQRPL